MTAILLAVIAAVIRIVERSKLRVRGFDTTITVAAKEASPEEISSHDPEVLAGPDGSYLINRPPSDWVIEESTFAAWVRRNLGIAEEAMKEADIPRTDDNREVRAFRSPRVISAIPLPGITKVDGRRFPTALEVRMQTMLTIFPINRAQPPFYVERPLSHNFLKEVAALTNIGTVTLRALTSGTLPGSGRKFQQAEFSQRLEDAIIDGKEGQSAECNITVIGIESDLCDYMLMMHYASRLSNRPDIEADQKALLALVSSFRPLKLANPEQKRQALKQEAEKQLMQLLAEKGASMFYTEIGLTLLRIKGFNLSDPKARLKAMELLKPFEIFAKEVQLEEQSFEQLFISLHKAEAGDATEFIKSVQDLIKQLEADEPEEVEGQVQEIAK